jgi:hypothetical protein
VLVFTCARVTGQEESKQREAALLARIKAQKTDRLLQFKAAQAQPAREESVREQAQREQERARSTTFKQMAGQAKLFARAEAGHARAYDFN